MSEFVYCYGIGPMHTPCLVRKHCQRHTRLREAHFHIPIETRWHMCQGQGDHFLPLEKEKESDEPVAV